MLRTLLESWVLVEHGGEQITTMAPYFLPVEPVLQGDSQLFGPHSAAAISRSPAVWCREEWAPSYLKTNGGQVQGLGTSHQTLFVLDCCTKAARVVEEGW